MPKDSRAIRKAHKKSRRGCLQCKRRHIKCDETHPTCIQCVNTEKQCSFLDVSSQSVPSATDDTSPNWRPSPADAEMGVSPVHTSSSGNGVVNMLHLQFFHHVRQSMLVDHSFFGPFIGPSVCEAITVYALDCPFLMHQIMALAALHLSVVHADQRLLFRYHATELQTNALSLFTTAVEGDTQNLSVAQIASRYLFASTLGLQVFYETFSLGTNDFVDFLSRYVNLLSLNRGILLQIDGSSWEALHNTPLRPVFELGTRLKHHETPDGPCQECVNLERLLDASDLGPVSRRTYQIALERMKVLFRLQRSDDAADLQSSAALSHSWPTSIPAEFSELLTQQRPEALAILAHYGGILHKHRKMWIIADAGAHLVKSITAFLGAYWAHWLVWPNRVIAEAEDG